MLATPCFFLSASFAAVMIAVLSGDSATLDPFRGMVVRRPETPLRFNSLVTPQDLDKKAKMEEYFISMN